MESGNWVSLQVTQVVFFAVSQLRGCGWSYFSGYNDGISKFVAPYQL